MFRSIFRLLPPAIVNHIGNEAFADLGERDEEIVWGIGIDERLTLSSLPSPNDTVPLVQDEIVEGAWRKVKNG